MEAIWETVSEFFSGSGFARFFEGDNWKCLIMIAIACVLLYLAIVKKFEPLLLVPIAFGMLLTNLPGAGLFHEELFGLGASREVTRIAVGPSAPPMMPMDAAMFWSGVPSVGIHWNAITDSANAM